MPAAEPRGFPASDVSRGGWVWAVCLQIALGLAFACAARGEKLPPAPEHYFNDYAHVVSAQSAQRLDHTLEDFERETSNQIVVAVYPTLETDSSMEDFTQRVAESWRVGQKLHKNGTVLFVFTQPHKIRIEVGYGLEGALPDVLAKQIIDHEIAPSFKAGNYDAGLTAGVNAILQATRGEYKGTGKTRGNQAHQGASGWSVLWIILIIAFVIFRSYGGGWFFPMGGGGGGGGWSFGGGGGGFSGGGGSFGGGGASGSW